MSDSWNWPGSRWWKFDFHAHTPASEDYGRGNPNQAQLKETTPEEWLLGFMRAGVDCVAITDHNTGAWIDRLKAALRELEQEKPQGFREIHLFPGVELSVNSGFHLIALLDTDSSTSDIDTLLGLVEYDVDGTKGDSDGVTRKSAIEVLEAILSVGGIPIPAHTDSPKGLLRLVGESSKAELDANTLRQIFDSEGILAMEVAKRDSAKPSIYLERKLTWSEVLGSDSHHPSDSDGKKFPGSHYTWVKMEKPSLEGLRLALLDGGGFSIRRSDELEPFDPFKTPEHFIEAVQIEDAQYMGLGQPAKLNFNPWFNALVGGRGTGKSTVVHTLRLAMRRELKSGDSEAIGHSRATFNAFNQIYDEQAGLGGLRNQTKIQLTVRRDGIPHRVLWRQGGGGTVVEEFSESEGWKKSATQTVTSDRFPMRIFSQGQIAELASEDRQELLDVIDEAAGVDALAVKLDQARSSFYATRAQIREIDDRLKRRDGLMIELEDVGRKLSRIEESGHAAILTAYRLRDRQSREVERQFKSAESAAQQIDDLAQDFLPEDIPDGTFNEDAEEDRKALESMTAIADAMRESSQILRDAANRLRQTTLERRDALAQSNWQTAMTQASASYENLVASLREEGVADPSEYGRLVQDRQRLDGELARIESEREERDRLIKQSQEQLKSVLESRRAMSDARTKYLSTALAQNGYVRIRIRPYGDVPRVVARSLREALGILDDRFQSDILVADEDTSRGCIAQLLECLPSNYDKRRPKFETRLENLKQRFKSACKGQGDFSRRFINNLHNQFKQNPEFLDKLLTWFPEDGLTVEYSRYGNGKGFRPISQGSAGQRAAAMLAFLLAHGNEPLILDQPEDDLDNHLIYDLVVRQIQENKRRRQIIVVTHNPNIVVNGDAEMLHALDFQQEQCVVGQSGSLQDKDMREKICDIMEGGREAFSRRYRRLGPE